MLLKYIGEQGTGCLKNKVYYCCEIHLDLRNKRLEYYIANELNTIAVYESDDFEIVSNNIDDMLYLQKSTDYFILRLKEIDKLDKEILSINDIWYEYYDENRDIIVKVHELLILQAKKEDFVLYKKYKHHHQISISLFDPEISRTTAFVGELEFKYYDIGKEFHGQKYTISKYLANEQLFINYIKKVLKDNYIDKLKVSCIENYGISNKHVRDLENLDLFINEEEYDLIFNKLSTTIFEIDNIDLLIKVLARDIMWFRIQSLDNKIQIDVGHELYFHIYYEENFKLKYNSTPEGLYIEHRGEYEL